MAELGSITKTPRSYKYKVLTPFKRRSKPRAVTNCEHKDARHYAKGMCNHCYHRYGRSRVPTLCQHYNMSYYAKGYCLNCYANIYSRNKRQAKKD
jgi:hypothetical protein